MDFALTFEPRYPPFSQDFSRLTVRSPLRSRIYFRVPRVDTRKIDAPETATKETGKEKGKATDLSQPRLNIIRQPYLLSNVISDSECCPCDSVESWNGQFNNWDGRGNERSETEGNERERLLPLQGGPTDGKESEEERCNSGQEERVLQGEHG